MTTRATIDLDPQLWERLTAVQEEGMELFHEFDLEVRQQEFHPFVAADYKYVLDVLLRFRSAGARFLEWGSATGVITIMADLLGFEAYGIEIDRELVRIARDLARRHNSNARFVAGSFIPTGYHWKSQSGDSRLGTLGIGESGYLELQHPLDDFDLIFGYPWEGEQPIMLDIAKRYAAPDARLLLLLGDGAHVYQQGRESALPAIP